MGCWSFVRVRHLWVLVRVWAGDGHAPCGQFGASSGIFLLTVPGRYFFCGSFVLFVYCVCHSFASVHICLVVTCWERADILALVCDV